jgi:1-acyl-sn-glycerol-3-phosphate acyltransferase
MVNIWIYIIFLIASVVYCLLALPVLIIMIPFATATFRRKVLRYAILYYGQCVIKCISVPFIKLKYIDKAPNETIPGIFVCNHRSGSDPFLVSMINRNLVQTVNYWPLKLPFLGFFARHGGYLNINALSAEELLDKARSLLEHKVTIVSFPEGTRSCSTEMGQFHGGVFRIALALKCPIYPLCIVGNENIPDRKFRFHAGRIRICKLPMITYDDYRDMSAFKLKNHLREIIMTATQEQDRTLTEC